ncbi:MAG: hypothetical protein OXI24_16505 [Candidatus Poribacteria bacterium]|nr:hypothetical protein [Candidatus Poribacteria bacterium]
MARPRKLSPEQVQQAAVDRRNGMTWDELRVKYECAINTVRSALAEYSDEFNPIAAPKRIKLERQLQDTQSKVDKIEKLLRKRFNLHI